MREGQRALETEHTLSNHQSRTPIPLHKTPRADTRTASREKQTACRPCLSICHSLHHSASAKITHLDPTGVWEPSTVYLRTGAPIEPRHHGAFTGPELARNHCPNWNTHTLHLGNRSASLPPSTARSYCPDLLDHESSHPPCSRACELKICRARGPVV